MPLTKLNKVGGSSAYEHFSSKQLHELTIEELAYVHLNRTHAFTHLNNQKLSSSLYDFLETAQASANNSRTRIYTPMLACFAVLDQIGGAYRRKSMTSQYQNGIKVALDLFGTYSKEEIEHLTTLRNGIYHDGSLLSKNRNGKTNVTFRLSSSASKTITMPEKAWDGFYHDSLTEYTSKINVRLLKNDVEQIVKNRMDHLLNGELVFNISDCREFFYKFLFPSEIQA